MSVARTLALALAVLAVPVVLAFAATARAEEPAKVEKTSKLEGENAMLDVKALDVVFEKVQVKHQPDTHDLLKLEKEPKAQWRPRISVDYANPGNVKLALTLSTTLQDDAGADLLTCEDTTTVSPHTKSDYKVLCMSKPLALADWPRVTRVKFKGSAVPAEPTLDKSFPWSKTTAEVKTDVGPIRVEKVVVTNPPDADEFAKAEKNPVSNIHPRVIVLLSNPTEDKVKVVMKVELQDKEGRPILACERTDKLAAKVRSDDFTVCMGQNMKTLDWKELTQVHLVIAVK
jgi:hypothetical protein